MNYEDDPSYNGTFEFDNDENIIFSYYFPNCLYVVGYAYNSESPLKEVYFRINNETEEHVCTGNYHSRNEVAEQAGYSVDNAARSGFGSQRTPLRLTGLDLYRGIYKLHLIARFENGTETEIAAPLLVVNPDTGNTFYEYEGDSFVLYAAALNEEDGIEHSYCPPDRWEEYVLFDGAAKDHFRMGDINFGCFSRCEIEYFTDLDWQPYVAGSMAEPSFIALKSVDSSSGYGGNGPYKDGVIVSATLSAPLPADPGEEAYTSLRTAFIDLSDNTYTGPVFLTAYPSTSGPVYVTKVTFYS